MNEVKVRKEMQMISKELQAILDLGFEYEYDVACGDYIFHMPHPGSLEYDFKVELDPPEDDGGWILHSSYYDDWSKENLSYGLDEKYLSAFLAFMKTLPREVN